jgi:tRNA-modifying protein YgfZ
MVEDYGLIREGAAIVPIADVSLLQLVGEDRLDWLQGQATNDLRNSSAAGTAFCLCSATGQMLSVLRAWQQSDRILLTCPRETVGAVLKRVETMVIMEDVEVEDLTDRYRLTCIQGPRAAEFVGEREGALVLSHDRTGSGGFDVWTPIDEVPTFDCRIASHEAYDVARLEAGIPIFGLDMSDRTLPPEMGPAFTEAHVSYTKGCYTGQEILHRIYSRGHTNRTWVALIADGPLEIGAQVDAVEREGVGQVTSAAFSPAFGHIGAAMLRKEAGTTVRVQTQRGEVHCEVQPMPLLRGSR